MSDSSNPITISKRLPSRGKRAAEGLLAIGLGVGAWALFFLINALVRVRFLPLPVVGLLLIAGGLYQSFTRDDSRTTSATQNRSQ